MDIELPVKIRRQPDYTTCGPTSLHALYAFHGDTISLEQVIEETTKVPGGGTVGVHLAVHALRRGYRAHMWVCNVRHLDPTWFQTKTDIASKIERRMAAKGLLEDPRYGPMVKAVREYQDRGGQIHWRDLTSRAIGGVLKRGLPLLAGTNGTYLYQCSRETAQGLDDVAGEAFGHFVVVCGYRSRDMTVSIADPLKDNPLTGEQYYRVRVQVVSTPDSVRRAGRGRSGPFLGLMDTNTRRPPHGPSAPLRARRSRRNGEGSRNGSVVLNAGVPSRGERLHYRATVHRLIGSIFLGTSSDDGNLLVLEPPAGRRPGE